MELNMRCEKLFTRFLDKGTLGEGAVRGPLSFTDQMEAAAYPLAMDMVMSYDNVAGLDKDERPGYVRFDRATLDRKMNGDVEESFSKVVGSTELTPEARQQMRQDLEYMVDTGQMTQAECDRLLAGGETAKPEVLDGETYGQLAKDGEKLVGWLESTGSEQDIDYIVSSPAGFAYLNVKPKGDGGFEAKATRVNNGGESYQETFSGTWNLLGA